MGKAVWFLLIVIVAVVVFYKFPDLLNPSAYNLPGGSTKEPVVVLDVQLKETGAWSSVLGLPEYTSNVTYLVHNVGDANASNVHVKVSVDTLVVQDFVVSSLLAGNHVEDTFSVVVSGEETKQVTLNASCANSTDATAFRLEAAFTRSSFNSQIAKLYVTPDDPLVLATLANITTNSLIPDWMEIRDWVADNIDYKYDNEAHGVVEYWQLPNETLTLRTGDCEDFAVLLCSLLRANGWDENEAYVVIGAKDGQYHGWLQLDVDAIGWQSIEPQAGAWNTILGDYLTLSGYQPKYTFNDQNYQTQ